MSDIQKVITVVQQSAIYVSEGNEGMRIDAVEEAEGYFLATGEETGESYQIQFSEVDLKNDLFYKLTLVED